MLFWNNVTIAGDVSHSDSRPCGRGGGSGALNEIQAKGWREKINVVLKSHFLAQEDGLRDTDGG